MVPIGLKRRALFVGGLFVCSGASSLIFQVLWIRVLALGVGSTTAATSMVLAVFFSGLALGSALAGRLAPRFTHPLRVYGLLEGFIGALSLGLLPLLAEVHQVLAVVPLGSSLGLGGTLVKSLVVATLLILPTTCMGASLPILVKLLASREQRLGRTIALLYALNTSGAVLGAAGSGFLLLPALGVEGANRLAAAINLGIFLLAVTLDKFWKVQAPEEKGETDVAGVPVLAGIRRRILLLACGVVGCATLIAEVVWTKYLGIFLGANVFGLSLVLALVLFGIALGSLLAAPMIDRIRDREATFVWLLLGIASSMILASLMLDLAPIAANVLAYYLGERLPLLAIKSVVATLTLFLPTCLSGALLPLASRMAATSVGSAPSEVGSVYAVNTFGTILGSCLSGIVLIPWLGSGVTMQLAEAGLLLCGLGLLIVFAPARRGWLLAAHLGAAVVAFALFEPGFTNILKSAYFQHTSPGMSFSEVVRYFSRTYEEFVWLKEGRNAVVSLSHDPADGQDYRRYLRLKTNGLNESVYSLDRPGELPKYEAMLGFLPFAFSRAPHRAFVVGYGAGFTVDVLSGLGLDEVRVAELEEAVLEAAEIARNGNDHLRERPNVKVEIEDARFVLATKAWGRFDLIVSQPSHSWLAGAANLFTREFFEIVKANLTERGVFAQWLNLYNMDADVLRCILRTLFSVFPHGAVFTEQGDAQVIMLASVHPLRLDLKRLGHMSEDKNLLAKLTGIPYNRPYDLLAQFALGREQVRSWVGEGVVNSDFNAHAELAQSTLFYQGVSEEPNSLLGQQYQASFEDILPPEQAGSPQVLAELLASMSADLRNTHRFNMVLDRLIKAGAEEETWSHLIGQYAYRTERYATAKTYLERVAERPEQVEAKNLLVDVTLVLGEFETAEHLLAGKADPIATCQLLDLALERDDLAAASGFAAQVDSDEAAHVAACGVHLDRVRGSLAFKRGQWEDATAWLASYHAAVPNDLQVLGLLAAAVLAQGKITQAEPYLAALQKTLVEERARVEALAKFFDQQGYTSDAEALRRRQERLDAGR